MWMITQPSGPKAVAIVSLGKYVCTAQRMISCGLAPSSRRLCSANCSSNSSDAVITCEDGLLGVRTGSWAAAVADMEVLLSGVLFAGGTSAEMVLMLLIKVNYIII